MELQPGEYLFISQSNTECYKRASRDHCIQKRVAFFGMLLIECRDRRESRKKGIKEVIWLTKQVSPQEHCAQQDAALMWINSLLIVAENFSGFWISNLRFSKNLLLPSQFPTHGNETSISIANSKLLRLFIISQMCIHPQFLDNISNAGTAL